MLAVWHDDDDEWTKDNLAITKKHRMENNQDGNVKINQVLIYIPTKHVTELNEIIYAGGKLACEKSGVPLKSTNKKSKPGWEIQLEMQIRKLWK